MQDLRDGHLKPIYPANDSPEAVQAAKDAVAPRQYQGPTFREGEVLEIRGGKFRVQCFKTRGRLILKGLPA